MQSDTTVYFMHTPFAYPPPPPPPPPPHTHTHTHTQTHTSIPGLAGSNDKDNAELFSLVDTTADAWFKIYAAVFYEKDEKRKVSLIELASAL